MLPTNFSAVQSADISISGCGARVVYHPASHTLTLYRLEGRAAVQLSTDSALGYPIVGGREVCDFTDYSCAVQRKIVGVLGVGQRLTVTSRSPATGLVRTFTLETSGIIRGVLYARTSYRAGGEDVLAEQFVESGWELFEPGPVAWSYNGGGESPINDNDTVRRIDLADIEPFYHENRQDCTSAAVPAADLYSAKGGIAIGDASATRREVRTPVQKIGRSACVSIRWPGKSISAGTGEEAGQSFIVVHKGDYFSGLRGYKNAMERLGVVMQTNLPERSYSLRWEGWGWAFDWTVDLILKELDFLQKAGVKQITIDDAWYDHPGDWQLNPEKFPRGETDMIRLVKAIHDHGMTALLWWRPCDGGRDNSRLYRDHPEYFVMRKDGGTAKLGTSGTIDTSNWSSDLGYALCPGSAGAIKATTDFIDRAMNVWGFDGFKGDFVWSLPKCYNPAHHHRYPEDSTERQAEFYRAAHETMVKNDPEVFNLLCNCSAPQDYYSLPYMTQIVTADPASCDQTRTRLKAYKALMGDCFPVTTDHGQPWYSTTVGTGAVMIEKTAYVGQEKAEYERWLGIADAVQLHKGRFIGDLYSYGFDPYETYVVKKADTLYYAFYRDGEKCRPEGYPPIELKGLDPEKLYRIVDYVNNRVVATNLRGGNAVFNVRFKKDLLIKAVELAVPDTEPVNPDWGFTAINPNDSSLVYTGPWVQRGDIRTGSVGAGMEFPFTGTSVRWYGDRSARAGSATVYLDGEAVAAVNTGGCAEQNVRLFEALDLPAAPHILRLVCENGELEPGRLVYEPAPPAVIFDQKIDALSARIAYTGNWQTEHGDAFYRGNSVFTSEAGACAEFTFCGTAIRWYGKTRIHYGVAWVYLDGELVKTVFAYGPAPESTGQLLFEFTGLPAGEHTVRIAHSRHTIDLEYLAYSSTEENA